jgi:hypothetical protein
MSIPGVGPSITGQGAQEAARLMCGHFVNLFQNRIVAGVALSVAAAVGLIGGLFGAAKLTDEVEKKTLHSIVMLTMMGAGLIALSVLVSKCLKLPFSPLASAGIATGAGVLTFLSLLVCCKDE